MRFNLEKVLVLKNISAFAQVSESALSDLIEISQEIGLKKGDILLANGQQTDSLYIILTGSLQIKKEDNIIKEIGSQEMFGELNALVPDTNKGTIIAIEDAILLQISSADLYQVMDLHPSILKGIIKKLVNRLKIYDNNSIENRQND